MTKMQSTKPIFLPIRTKRTFEKIEDQIRESFYSGVFKPGDRLPSERDLAGQFRTGRMVVREALRTLEQSGLIHIKHGSNGGAFIKEIDASVITRSISDMVNTGNVTIRDLTEVRLGIEKVILEFAIKRITDEELDLIKKNIEATEKEESKGIRPTKHYFEFHLLLAKSSKNPLFETIVESVMNVVASFLEKLRINKKEYGRGVLDYHKQIYQAIQDRDGLAAKEILEKHLVDVHSRFSKSKRIK